MDLIVTTITVTVAFCGSMLFRVYREVKNHRRNSMAAMAKIPGPDEESDAREQMDPLFPVMTDIERRKLQKKFNQSYKRRRG